MTRDERSSLYAESRMHANIYEASACMLVQLPREVAAFYYDYIAKIPEVNEQRMCLHDMFSKGLLVKD